MNRWAFRTLAERGETFVGNTEDSEQIRQAVALDGLHFDLLSAEQSTRLAVAIERAADELREEYRDSSDLRDRDFAVRLDELRQRLSDLTDR